MRWSGIALVLLTLQGLAQVSSDLGRFEVDVSRGCVPLTVNVTPTDTFGAISRQYFYENSVDVTNSTTHTYNTPGTYFLVQLVGVDVDPKTDTLIIEVFEDLAPEFDYYKCAGNSVYIENTDSHYDELFVEFFSGANATLLNGQSIVHTFMDPMNAEFTVTGRFTGGSGGCQSITLQLSPTASLASPDINNLNVAQVCEGNFSASATVTNPEPVRYRVLMSENSGPYLSVYEGDLNPNFTIESLPPFTEGADLCFRVDAINVCTAAVTSGTPQCLTNVRAEPVGSLYSSYEATGILINLPELTFGSYIIERSSDQQSFSTVGESPGSYTDQAVFSGRSYLYQVSYSDTCSSTWGTEQTRPPFISSTETAPNVYQIDFSEAIHNLPADFSYTGILEGNGMTQNVTLTGNTTSIVLTPDLGEVQILTIVGDNGSVQIRSNRVRLTYELEIFIPKAFTPNGDGLNDLLQVFGLNNSEATFSIYTRWGQRIYSEVSTDPSWDGKINGSVVDEGIYLYEISLNGFSTRPQRGTFVVLRK